MQFQQDSTEMLSRLTVKAINRCNSRCSKLERSISNVTKPVTVYVALGANIGKPAFALAQAVKKLQLTPGITLKETSMLCVVFVFSSHFVCLKVQNSSCLQTRSACVLQCRLSHRNHAFSSGTAEQTQRPRKVCVRVISCLVCAGKWVVKLRQNAIRHDLLTWIFCVIV